MAILNILVVVTRTSGMSSGSGISALTHTLEGGFARSKVRRALGLWRVLFPLELLLSEGYDHTHTDLSDFRIPRHWFRRSGYCVCLPQHACSILRSQPSAVVVAACR